MSRNTVQLGPTCAFYAYVNALAQLKKTSQTNIHHIVQKSIETLRPKRGTETKKQQQSFTYVGEVFTNYQATAMINAVSKNLSINPLIKEYNLEQLEKVLNTLDENEILLFPIQLVQKIKNKKIENVHWISAYHQNNKTYYINPNNIKKHRLSKKKLTYFIQQSKKVKNTTFSWYEWHNQMVYKKNNRYHYKLSITKRIFLKNKYTKFFDKIFNQLFTAKFINSLTSESNVNFKNLHFFKVTI